MFLYFTGNTVLHMRKQCLPVICPFYVSDKLWTNCAESAIIASLLSKTSIEA